MIEYKVIKSRLGAWLLGDQFWVLVRHGCDRGLLIEQLRMMERDTKLSASELRDMAKDALLAVGE